jgi:dTDP-4-dehydrorhamnose reductase
MNLRQLPLDPERYVLITGVSGYVGEHLARRFTAIHPKVAGTFLQTPVMIPGVATVPLDATDPRAVSRLIRDMRPAAVVHCAAQTNTGWCEDHPDHAREAIVTATRHLTEALGERAPETPLVAFSTDLVFDGEEAPYAEHSPTRALNVYGRLKAETEPLVLGLPRGAVLRSALVFGPPATVRASFLSWMVEALAGGTPLDLFEDEWRTPVFIDDLAPAVSLILNNFDPLASSDTPMIFHAGGPDRLSRLEMGRRLAEIFLLPEQPIRPRRRSDAGTVKLRARDVSLQHGRLQSLGWKPTTFDDGLKACLSRWTEWRPAS